MNLSGGLYLRLRVGLAHLSGLVYLQSKDGIYVTHVISDVIPMSIPSSFISNANMSIKKDNNKMFISAFNSVLSCLIIAFPVPHFL